MDQKLFFKAPKRSRDEYTRSSLIFLSTHVIKWILQVNSFWTQYELILV